jgi:hypothetical protein
MNLCVALFNYTLNPSWFVHTKDKVRPATGRQEIQKHSVKDRRAKIDFALGSLLFIVFALNRLCAAIVLPASRSDIASSTHYYDDIEMLQRQLIQGGLSV